MLYLMWLIIIIMGSIITTKGTISCNANLLLIIFKDYFEQIYAIQLCKNNERRKLKL